MEAFLEEEAFENSSSKTSIRLELARAKNRKETTYQNMQKKKRKGKKLFEKLRELEAAYDIACNDVKRF